MVEEEKQLVNVLPTMRQVIHRKLAQYCLHDKGNDLYFFYEALNLLRSATGEDILKEHYADNYPEIVKKLNICGVKIARIKFFYDNIDEKDEKTFDKYLKEMQNYPMIQRVVYDVFMVLVNNSKMKYLLIPNDAFIRELKKGYRPRLLQRRITTEEVMQQEEGEE